MPTLLPVLTCAERRPQKESVTKHLKELVPVSRQLELASVRAT
jgi:hypothetical protein